MRLLGIDPGKKRVGLAVTDPLRIICSPLDTVDRPQLIAYLRGYINQEEVASFILGLPKGLNGQETDGTLHALEIEKDLKRAFPSISVVLHDERFTSKMASQAIIQSGTRKKARRDKGLVDRTSAAIILQSYLEATAS